MDRPDTILELQREVVERLGAAHVPDRPNDVSFTEPEAEGTAHVNIALSRIWFVTDANGRAWSEAPGTLDDDRQRHVAIDLRLADHDPQSGMQDSKLVVTKVLGLPVPTIGTSSCAGETIQANVVPLRGRLTIHEQLERKDVTDLDGNPAQTIALDFARQQAPVFRSTPPSVGVDARIFGPDVKRAPDGSVNLPAGQPTVVWELPGKRSCA